MDDARERLRAAIPAGYSGPLHFAFTSTAGLAVVADALFGTRAR
jgi:hypothetical protein